MKLRPAVAADLRRHGIEPGLEEAPEALKERLNEVYLQEVRELKARHQRGEIARRDYAGAAEALRDRFALLGLPLPLWRE